MKKIIALLVFVSCLVIPSFAQSNGSEAKKPIWDHGDNVSSISYHNVNVYRVLDHRDAYIVIYEKQLNKVGSCIIPKEWHNNPKPGEIRKLSFRNKSKGVPSYMTVVYKDGEFYRVFLTLTRDHRDPVWGLASNGVDLSGMNTEKLEVTF